jgi:glycerate kinase
MRILVAPDKFAGTLTAVQAADAVVEGWRRAAPSDEVSTLPMSDGGPGFVHALQSRLDGELLAVSVSGPYGGRVPATVLVSAGTAYIEAAQACGLHLTPPDSRDPEHATSFGVGELIGAAVDAGASRVVVGLGGTASNDGGAGMLHALGADADVDLRGGVAALSGLAEGSTVDLTWARRRVDGLSLVAASDVDNPLLGLRGATNVFGAQKGVLDDRKYALDAALERYACATDRSVADFPGAGAAGGLGFALLVLGGTRQPGVELVADVLGLAARCRDVDLVISGEGAFDYSSRAGKVVYGVAQVAGKAVRPCIVLAGRVDVGTREMRALGVEQAYSMVDKVGEARAFADPTGALEALAEHVAGQWSR